MSPIGPELSIGAFALGVGGVAVYATFARENVMAGAPDFAVPVAADRPIPDEQAEPPGKAKKDKAAPPDKGKKKAVPAR